MARFDSDLMTAKVPFRGLQDGQEFQVTATVKVAAGVKLTSGDVIRFGRLGPGITVAGVRLSTDGDLDNGASAALAGSIGFVQALDEAGNVLTVDDKTGTTYPSPATSAAALVAAANTALAAALRAPGVAEYGAGDLATYDADGLSGPADVALTITATADGVAAATTHVRVTLTCIQKAAEQGEWSGELAKAYKNRYDGNSSGGLVS